MRPAYIRCGALARARFAALCFRRRQRLFVRPSGGALAHARFAALCFRHRSRSARLAALCFGAAVSGGGKGSLCDFSVRRSRSRPVRRFGGALAPLGVRRFVAAVSGGGKGSLRDFSWRRSRSARFAALWRRSRSRSVRRFGAFSRRPRPKAVKKIKKISDWYFIFS